MVSKHIGQFALVAGSLVAVGAHAALPVAASSEFADAQTDLLALIDLAWRYMLAISFTIVAITFVKKLTRRSVAGQKRGPPSGAPSLLPAPALHPRSYSAALGLGLLVFLSWHQEANAVYGSYISDIRCQVGSSEFSLGPGAPYPYGYVFAESTGVQVSSGNIEQWIRWCEEAAASTIGYKLRWDLKGTGPYCWEFTQSDYAAPPIGWRVGTFYSDAASWTLSTYTCWAPGVDGDPAQQSGVLDLKEYNVRKGEPSDPPKNVGLSCPVEGNPISVGMGNKYLAETDVSDFSSGKLNFARYYNSSLFVSGENIGAHWRHTYARSVEQTLDPDRVVVRRADGKAIKFVRSAGQWTSDPDVVETLEESTDGAGVTIGWRLQTAAKTVEEFDATGRLQTIEFIDGSSLAITYDTNGRLLMVADDFGRTLSFTADALGRIETVTDPSGALYRYQYDAVNNLVRVIYPDETPVDDADNPFREYLYEGAAFPHALTGIIDEAGNRLATYAYDAQGRAVMSTHAGDAGRVDIAYDQPGGAVTVDNPKGPVRGYTMEVEHGVVKPSGIARQ